MRKEGHCELEVFLFFAFRCRTAECRLRNERNCADAARAHKRVDTCADAARAHKRVDTYGFHPLVNHPFPLESLAQITEM